MKIEAKMFISMKDKVAPLNSWGVNYMFISYYTILSLKMARRPTSESKTEKM